jgi:hypothetical protein
MKKKFFGLLVLSVLTSVTIFNAPVSAITTGQAQAACSSMGGTFSVNNVSSSGEASWSCSAPTSGTADSQSVSTYKTGCETLGGTFSVGSADASGTHWSCSGFNVKVYATSDGNPAATPTSTNTYGGNNGGVDVSPSAGGTHSCGGVSTAILQCSGDEKGGAIFEILATALSVFTFGVSAAAVIGVIIAAYQYITARDNSAVVAKAKNRIAQIVIGLVIWVMIWVILEMLLPGGLFANGQ